MDASRSCPSSPKVETQPQSAASTRCNAAKWTVDEVSDYIQGMTGNPDLANAFRKHDVNGEALLLTKEEHMVNHMGISLGTALRIVSRINLIRF